LSSTKLRILHVAVTLDPAYGGPARVAAELSIHQARAGHTVILLASRTSDTSLGADLRHSRLTVEELESRGVTLWPHRMLRTLRREVRSADVIHVHGAYRPLVSAAAWMSLILKRPLVTRPHGTYDHVLRSSDRPCKRSRRAYEVLVEFPILRSRHTVVHCTSRAEERELCQAAPGVENVQVAGNGVDSPSPDFFALTRPAARQEFGVAEAAFVFLYLGRITPKKRVEDLIDAFEQARRRSMPDALLLIAGPVDRASKHIDLAREGVIWVGTVDGYRREAAFRSADIFVLTSGGENFGVAPMEAAARSLPAVISDAVASSELLPGGSFIQTDGSPGSVPKALTEAYRLSAADLTRMGREARDAWRRHASWPAVLPQVQSLYSEAIRVCRSQTRS
jgi:glycosyltransferase involved in cell wall biosynthesis